MRGTLLTALTICSSLSVKRSQCTSNIRINYCSVIARHVRTRAILKLARFPHEIAKQPMSIDLIRLAKSRMGYLSTFIAYRGGSLSPIFNTVALTHAYRCFDPGYENLVVEFLHRKVADVTTVDFNALRSFLEVRIAREAPSLFLPCPTTARLLPMTQWSL